MYQMCDFFLLTGDSGEGIVLFLRRRSTPYRYRDWWLESSVYLTASGIEFLVDFLGKGKVIPLQARCGPEGR